MKKYHNDSLFTRQKIFIYSLPESVWNIQCDINNWKNWNPDILYSSLDGPLAPNSKIELKYKHFHFVGKLEIIEMFNRLIWVVHGMGIAVKHCWLFEECNLGTLITSEEDLSGWPTHIMKNYTKHAMEDFVENWLKFLKKKAEKL
jgi:hypothetical protein